MIYMYKYLCCIQFTYHNFKYYYFVLILDKILYKCYIAASFNCTCTLFIMLWLSFILALLASQDFSLWYYTLRQEQRIVDKQAIWIILFWYTILEGYKVFFRVRIIYILIHLISLYLCWKLSYVFQYMI